MFHRSLAASPTPPSRPSPPCPLAPSPPPPPPLPAQSVHELGRTRAHKHSGTGHVVSEVTVEQVGRAGGWAPSPSGGPQAFTARNRLQGLNVVPLSAVPTRLNRK